MSADIKENTDALNKLENELADAKSDLAEKETELEDAQNALEKAQAEYDELSVGYEEVTEAEAAYNEAVKAEEQAKAESEQADKDAEAAAETVRKGEMILERALAKQEAASKLSLEDAMEHEITDEDFVYLNGYVVNIKETKEKLIDAQIQLEECAQAANRKKMIYEEAKVNRERAAVELAYAQALSAKGVRCVGKLRIIYTRLLKDERIGKYPCEHRQRFKKAVFVACKGRKLLQKLCFRVGTDGNRNSLCKLNAFFGINLICLRKTYQRCS